MTSRIVSVCALAVGLTLLLTLGLTLSARGIETESADQALPPGEAASNTSRRAGFAVGRGRTSGVTFTPVATLHLPIVFDDWNRCGVSPTLIKPPDGINLDTVAPLFMWDAGENPYATRLYARISKDPEFVDWDVGISGSAQGEGSIRFLENFEPNTTYYWRAWLVCGNLKGPYSEVFSFRTAVEGTLPSSPTLTAPDDGAATSGLSVRLDWEPVSGAREYLVRYQEVDAGYRWVWTSDTEVLRDLSGGTTYEWQVAARNDYGIGPDSETWRFTTPVGSSVAMQDAKNGLPGEDEEGIVIETP
jgi:hypothetical protein